MYWKFVSSQNSWWKLISIWGDLEAGLWKSLGHESGVPMNGISTLMKNVPECSLDPPLHETKTRWPRSASWSDTRYAMPWSCSSQSPELWEKCLLYQVCYRCPNTLRHKPKYKFMYKHNKSFQEKCHQTIRLPNKKYQSIFFW